MKKVEISKTLNLTDRNVKKEMLLQDSEQHRTDVKNIIMSLADSLAEQADKHDWTKIEYIDEFYDAFVWTQLGAKFSDSAWWEKHLEERNHLNDRVPTDVNLLDVVEMIVDCVAAGLARTGTVYDITVSPSTLQTAFDNTVKLILQNVEVKNENK